jgi:hypothetical protein
VIKLSSKIVRVINWKGLATVTGDNSNAHGDLLGKLEEKL